MTRWNIVILGLSITSSWGNGHATTFRALVRELTRRGHDVTFLERDVPWYRDNRDLPRPPFGETVLYDSLETLFRQQRRAIEQADLVMIGSYVPDGRQVATWALDHARGVVAFYDIDTPITLRALERDGCEYIDRELVPRFDLYLSFTGGPTLRHLERKFGAQRARALYCSVDPELYFPESMPTDWDLGYLGTYAPDRQPGLQNLLLQTAQQWPRGRFVVAGSSYPESVSWPPNVQRIEHLPPDRHRAFYNAQRFTLNLTRTDMIRSGYAPSVRLFEAAACGTPLISDWWTGLDELFEPDNEILIARTPADTLHYLQDIDAGRRARIGAAARARVLAAHTAHHRVLELETFVAECCAPPARAVR